MAAHPGQLPVDVRAAEAGGKPYGRQAIWEALRAAARAGELCTLAELARRSGQNPRTAKEYLDCLLAGGYVQRNAQGEYSLIRDNGHLHPRLNKQGQPIITATDHMWRAMKMLRNFSAPELALKASTEEIRVDLSYAGKYCQHLHKAGYLVLVQAATSTRKAVYALPHGMRTGPRAPMVQRAKVVFDPNLNRVMWHEELEP